ncbi:MAG: isomerizing glutamine--fructose-6-phosphate transaminase, partial [Planctomycetaceae bacterium]|nr:isomerizing glutamine--fructose-6-phosphate transaminase [Planctomycetaceae bacterium]
MCGIVGYIGSQPPVDFLIRGLRMLEYRGYDSAGVAVNDSNKKIRCVKTPGRIDVLDKLVQEQLQPLQAAGLNGVFSGIGHTRWATHGLPTKENAHPHISFDGAVAVVHNGVIENYQTVKNELQKKGIRFTTQTDTESITHLLAFYLKEEQAKEESKTLSAEDLILRVVNLTLSQLHGTYGLAILFRDYPDIMVGAKFGSPLIFGIGKGESFLTSDAATLAGYTDRIITLSDHEVVCFTASDYSLHHRDTGTVQPRIEVLDIDPSQVDKGGFEHYMLKEIFEQPEAVRNTLRGRFDYDSATAKFGGLNLSAAQLLSVQRIMMTACGTSWHASLVGEYQIEMLSRIPVEVEYASELRYRNPPLDKNTLLFALTQSGETADTLA